MDKYQNALLEMARHSRSLKEINARIGKCLSDSYLAAESTWPNCLGSWPEAPKEWRDIGGKNLWLHRAYKIEREHYGPGVFDTYHPYHEEDVEGYLAEHCKHALKAHQLIQERKEIKKALGVAKRRVTFLANRLLEAELTKV